MALFNKIDIEGGVVDQSYEGSVKVIVFNHGDSDFEICIGDRIAQFIVAKIEPTVLVELEVGWYGRDRTTSRGFAGFGSTGFN